MVKVLTFIKRKAGMPVDEFQDYWRARHPDAVTKLPGIRRYVQSHVLPGTYAKGEPVHDGIAEVWADDTDALRAMTKSPAHPALIADEERFIDRSRMGIIVTDDEVAKEGFGVLPSRSPMSKDSGDVKGVEFFTRKPGMSVEDFQRHWRTTHAALATKIPGVGRYVVSATRPSAYTAGRAPAYDGAALMWFESMDALKTAGGSVEYKAMVADRAQFLAPGQPPFLLTKEYVIVG
jgi:uncharacterized protein (TIGR02118 family)